MEAITRHHRMPFGTDTVDDRVTRFRLWAPGAEQVELQLEAGERRSMAMTAEPNGWFVVTAEDAPPGSRYRFRIDGDMAVPDPASRFQPEDVHGPSEVIDPDSYHWQDRNWRGRPWREVVLYELHVGSFSPTGTFEGVREKLDYLVDLGVTAIELMPVADFPGRRNWGYDGCYLFAPDSRYGRPDDLKALVDAAHQRGLMVFMDVVYNHFGPEGNYLHVYAPQFFSERHHTAWGAAINFDGESSRWVREFFIRNALYWLEEYHIDGLRLDAVHAIADDSRPDILTELSARVQGHFGDERHIHLVLENDHNAAHYLTRSHGTPLHYAAQWNDDIHHALHVQLTGEDGGYYSDYADDALRHLGRCLAEGFAYQGDPSRYREGAVRGEPSAQLPPDAFVNFLQNHDQVGNRAFGERIDQLAAATAVRAANAILLLAPSPPLLFMGQEWGCRQPFPFFCDFGDDLADKVTAGRRKEFARFPEFRDPEARERIPDPVAEETFASARLDWSMMAEEEAQRRLAQCRELLAVRSSLTPHWRALPGNAAAWKRLADNVLQVRWQLGDGSEQLLLANLDDTAADVALPEQTPLYATHHPAAGEPLPPWSVFWFLRKDPAA